MPSVIELLPHYPEVDLIDYHARDPDGDTIPLIDPLLSIPNPHFDEGFKRIMAQHAERTGENPLSMLSLGLYPFDVNPREVLRMDLRLGPHDKDIPVMTRITHPPSLKFYENLNPGGNTLLYKVTVVWEEKGILYDAVLKVFPDDDPNDLDGDSDVEENDFEIEAESFTYRFYCECTAYAHLMFHGVSDIGYIPNCYGWFVMDMDASPNIPDAIRTAFAPYGRPPRCLLCEYIPDAQRLSIWNANETVARNALIALQAVHKALVQHNDIYPRNILVTPKNRVVLIDFDRAEFARGHELPNRYTLMQEFMLMWETFFRHLIPNSFIGWDHGPIQYN